MMKQIIALVIIISISSSLHAEDITSPHKILIAYFSLAHNLNIDLDTFPGDIDGSTHASVKYLNNSYKGDTEIVAEWIQKQVGGELFSIESTIRYPNNFDDTVDQNEEELADNLHPTLITQVTKISNYDTIFLGYPVWYRDIPIAMYSFIEQYDLSDKKIIPFALHMGGGLGKSVRTIRQMENQAEVYDPLLILDYHVLKSEKEVTDWISHLNL